MSSAREYLFSLEQLGIKLGLDQIRALVRHLDAPDQAFRSIVVAGTNGKGSTTAMVERGLRAQGYQTGRYTSPHLVDLEERFFVRGQPVGRAALDAAIERVREAAQGLPAPPSFFEATTAAAFEVFRGAHLDLAVLEVGLGGRLDATNVVSPIGVGITAIDFDHESYLGSTIEAIAAEKAGIIKPGIAAVLGNNPEPVRRVVLERCQDEGAEFIYAPDGVEIEVQVVNGLSRVRLKTPDADYGTVTLALRGRHQIENAVTAVRLLETLARRGGLPVGADAIRTALTDVEWPARLECRQWRGIDVLIDGAHNPAGARALAAYVEEVFPHRVPVVLGVMADKKIEAMASAFDSIASVIVCTAPASPRAERPESLARRVREVLPRREVIVCERPLDAVPAAAGRGTPVIVAGSLYLAGEVRAELS